MQGTLMHRISTSHSKNDDGWIHQVQIDEEDSMLHNPFVAQELSKILSFPWDEKKLRSQTMGEVVDGSLSTITKVSHSQFYRVLVGDNWIATLLVASA